MLWLEISLMESKRNITDNPATFHFETNTGDYDLNFKLHGSDFYKYRFCVQCHTRQHSMMSASASDNKRTPNTESGFIACGVVSTEPSRPIIMEHNAVLVHQSNKQRQWGWQPGSQTWAGADSL